MNAPTDSNKQNPIAATILVVDDDPTNISVLNDVLRPHYRVRAARSGPEALRVASTEPRPDLILLDVMMPDMDGYAVLAKLRESPANDDILVIFVTALNANQDEQRGLDLGAVDYITKPVAPGILLTRVRTQLEARQARAMLKQFNSRLVHQVEEGAHALQQAQLQLLQAEKMASLGQLAAGVAHELNNPISFVHSNLGTLASYLKDIFAIVDAYAVAEAAAGPAQAEAAAAAIALKTSKNYDFLREDIAALMLESRDGLDRVRTIVEDLKGFSRASEIDWEWADINRCIDTTLNIVWNELKYKCTVVKDCAQDLPAVHCLPSQINQVVLNLLVNASQAIDGKGEITICTRRSGDAAVEMVISDTGKGIAAENLQRIFDPFFTTKPVGQGTGLGLSIVWNIIGKHHGKISVSSVVGKGTSFTITLPIDAAIVDAKPAPDATPDMATIDGVSPSATAKSASFARPPCSAVVSEAVVSSAPTGEI